MRPSSSSPKYPAAVATTVLAVAGAAFVCSVCRGDNDDGDCDTGGDGAGTDGRRPGRRSRRPCRRW